MAREKQATRRIGRSGGASGRNVHPLTGLHEAIGNRGMQRVGAVAPIGVSASVASGTIQRSCDCGNTDTCECGDKASALPWIQRENADAGGGHGTLSRSAVAAALSGQGAGRPLDATTRAFMEPRFGRDFGGVRIHADSAAATAAKALRANAFATGSDIFFGEGRYQPNSAPGRRLLAHELTHTVQQSGNRDQTGRHADFVGDPHGPAEREAGRIAESVAAGGQAGPTGRVAPAGLFRDPAPPNPDLAGPLPTAHAADYDPCAVQCGQLTNYQLLTELNTTASYLRARNRGEDAYYDYANLMRRLVAERRRRIGMGHVWLAGDEPAFPSELYRMDAEPSGVMTVTIIDANTLAGAPAPLGATVMRPAQFDAFLSQAGIERIDVAEFYRRMEVSNRHEPLSILPPRSPRSPWDADIRDFFPPDPSITAGPGGLPGLLPSGLANSPFDLFARGNLTRQVYSTQVNPANPRSVTSAETQWRGGLFEQAFGHGTYSDVIQLRDLNRVDPSFRVFDFAGRQGAEDLFSVTHSARTDPNAVNAWYRTKFARMTGGEEPGNFAQSIADLGAVFDLALTAADLNARNRLVVPDDHVGRAQAQAEWLVTNRPTRVAPLLDVLLIQQPVVAGGISYTAWNQVQAARANGTLADADYANLLAQLAPRACGRVVGAGVTMTEIAEMQRIRVATQNFGAGSFNAIASPEVLAVRRLVANGMPEPEAIADVAHGNTGRGAAFGAGVALAYGGFQYARSGFDSRVGRDVLFGLAPQTAGGALGGYAQTQWNARLGGPLLDEAIAGGGSSILARSAAIRIGGGGIIGGPLSTLTSWATMGLQQSFGDADFTGIDYAAIGERTFVAGGIAGMVGEAGALGTAAAFSAAGSEIPFAGNAAGFILGLGTYWVVDAFWGDDIEQSAREALGEKGCVNRGAG
jgi:hypothetical protein